MVVESGAPSDIEEPTFQVGWQVLLGQHVSKIRYGQMTSLQITLGNFALEKGRF